MLDGLSKEEIGVIGIVIGAIIAFLGVWLTADSNLKIAREKLKADNKLAIATHSAISQLLRHPNWELRSFDTIKKHVRGFSDDELRQHLVAAGAISFESKDERRELWGLRERNSDKLEPSDQAPWEIEQPDPCYM